MLYSRCNVNEILSISRVDAQSKPRPDLNKDTDPCLGDPLHSSPAAPQDVTLANAVSCPLNLEPPSSPLPPSQLKIREERVHVEANVRKGSICALEQSKRRFNGFFVPSRKREGLDAALFLLSLFLPSTSPLRSCSTEGGRTNTDPTVGATLRYSLAGDRNSRSNTRVSDGSRPPRRYFTPLTPSPTCCARRRLAPVEVARVEAAGLDHPALHWRQDPSTSLHCCSLAGTEPMPTTATPSRRPLPTEEKLQSLPGRSGSRANQQAVRRPTRSGGLVRRRNRWSQAMRIKMAKDLGNRSGCARDV